MLRSGLIVFAAACVAAVSTGAQAQGADGDQVSELVVTAARLDAARASIEPALGATTYSLPEAFVGNLPGGRNNELSQVLLQAPGVAQDGFGQLHIRGDHGDIQYRLNNVILPEGLEVFGQSLSPRLASNVDLVTGALPAQYGLRTAGVVNITTKSGGRTGGEASLYGGGHGLVTPSVEYGASSGPSSGFGALGFTRTDVGVESPDGRARPLHDRSDQLQGFGYFDHILNDVSRLSLILGLSRQSFEIPNVGGLEPDLRLSVAGRSTFRSEDLDQRQREATTYAIASYLRAGERLDLQASLFARVSALRYTPDVVGELLFNGLAQAARKTDHAAGLQVESTYRLGASHTLRAGLILQQDRTASRTTSHVLPEDDTGAQTSETPLIIAGADRLAAGVYSAYLQDEFRLASRLTLNYGLRFDAIDAFRNERQVSPRANLVWTPWEDVSAHVGYARYFTPPSFELVADETLESFAGTSAQAPEALNDRPRAERADYLDLGIERRHGGLTLGIDAYHKRSRRMVDVGQFGAPIILTPFNYDRGLNEGVEFSANYAAGPLSAYGNLAIARARGKGIISSQFNFEPEDLAYFQGHWFPLDHDQRYTASAGANWRLGAGGVSADLIYGSGLRKDGDTPNGAKLPAYLQVNLGARYDLGTVRLRADLINAFDRKYAIRDGSGVGVGAPQFGPRRGVFVGISRDF